MSDKYAHFKKASQERRRLLRMCLRKKPFETKEDAFQKGQDVYKCDNCGKYHRSGRMKSFLSKYEKKIQKQKEWTLLENIQRFEELEIEIQENSRNISIVDKILNRIEHEKRLFEKEKAKLENKMSHNAKYKNRLVSEIKSMSKKS